MKAHMVTHTNRAMAREYLNSQGSMCSFGFSRLRNYGFKSPIRVHDLESSDARRRRVYGRLLRRTLSIVTPRAQSLVSTPLPNAKRIRKSCIYL